MKRRLQLSGFLFASALFLIAAFSTALADDSVLSVGGLNLSFSDTSSDEQSLATPLKILLGMTLLSLAPALLVVVTSFTRIVIVLAMLRHAFGMPSTPPNTVLISLALFLTVFTMWPVWQTIDETAVSPYNRGELSDSEAFSNAVDPLRKFMISQTREKDVELVLELSGAGPVENADEIPTWKIITAFLLSELKTAFQIGFAVFLPFLLVDLVVASVLMSLGMIMVPPMTISLPVKVLMFVLIDGWVLVTDALARSFIQ